MSAHEREIERLMSSMARELPGAVAQAERAGNDRFAMLLARSAEIVAQARAGRAQERARRTGTEAAA